MVNQMRLHQPPAVSYGRVRPDELQRRQRYAVTVPLRGGVHLGPFVVRGQIAFGFSVKIDIGLAAKTEGNNIIKQIFGPQLQRNFARADIGRQGHNLRDGQLVFFMLLVLHYYPPGHLPLASAHVNGVVDRHGSGVQRRGHGNGFKGRPRLIGKLKRQALAVLARIRGRRQNPPGLGLLHQDEAVVGLIIFDGFIQGFLGVILGQLVYG